MTEIRDPHVTEIWEQNREITNLVVGAILGAYLGLSISREGLSTGSNYDLFMLIVLTAFAASQLIMAGNRWFTGRKYLATYFFASFLLTAAISVLAAGKLGVEISIFVTIYVAWAFLIVAQIIVFEFVGKLKKKLGK